MARGSRCMVDDDGSASMIINETDPFHLLDEPDERKETEL